jgi:hypothetical protein
MEVKNFWDRVKKLIKARNISCVAAAKACKIPSQTFYGWINKDLLPGLLDAYVIARFLGVTVEYLITGKENRPRPRFKKVRDLLRQAGEKLEEMEAF